MSMTIFNPEGKETLTYGELLSPAMAITDQADADNYFKKLVEYMEIQLENNPRSDGMTATEIARINLGYYAGYYDRETMDRVNRLFKTHHPIFN